jgi:hypothetical protein
MARLERNESLAFFDFRAHASENDPISDRTVETLQFAVRLLLNVFQPLKRGK